MNISINIDDYLSEDEKKNIVAEAFKEQVKQNVLEAYKEDQRLAKKDRMSDYERVVSNAVWYYLENNIDEMIGQDTKALIREKVNKTILSHNYSYSLFRKADVWEKEDSVAQKIANEAVIEIKDEMKTKIHARVFEAIDALDKNALIEQINEVLYSILTEKLKP